MKKLDGNFGMRTYLKTMTSLGRNVIAEFYKKQLEKERYKLSVIELDNYFTHSGKEEINNKIISMTPSYRRKKKIIRYDNDMSKYKLKKYYNVQ